jgi:site-specific DNA-methyltransferase (adenine-specific)
VATPYYSDDLVTLWHGDCREVIGWADTAQVLITDPPYGRNWRQGLIRNARYSAARTGIAGDEDTSLRDWALEEWLGRPAAVFGDLTLAPPAGTKQTLVYRKPPDSGARGAMGGFRRDAEAIYLIGPWPTALGGLSSILETSARSQGNPSGVPARYGHPHAKPLDVMGTLIAAAPGGIIADPFAGAGSTLVAARNLGRHAIGVEIEERYCEIAARRLAQGVLLVS